MKNLYGAFLKAQQEFPAVPKDGTNPAFRSKYATLGSVQDAALPVLAKHGLIVLQSVRTEWGGSAPIVYVGAALVHAESGEMVNQEIGLIPNKPDPQGIGSAISYGRRYLLLTMLGLTADDDDGNAASRPAAQTAPPPRSAHRPAPPSPDDDIDVSERPRWKTTAEAKEWARGFNVFNAPKHLDNAYALACEKGGVVKGKDATPAIMEATFDAWFIDVMRRAADREPAQNGN